MMEEFSRLRSLIDRLYRLMLRQRLMTNFDYLMDEHLARLIFVCAPCMHLAEFIVSNNQTCSFFDYQNFAYY
jgi:hypothetical protein